MKKPASSVTSSSPRQPHVLATSCCVCPLACQLSKIYTTETLPGECEPMWRGLLIDSHCFSQVLESSSFPSSAQDAGALSGRPATFLDYCTNVLCLKDLKTAGNKFHYVTLSKQASTLVYSNVMKIAGHANNNTLENFLFFDIFDLECACFRKGETRCSNSR